MDRCWVRRVAWAAIAALFVLLSCHEWFAPDIWYHLYLGDRILETHRAQPPDRLLLQQAGFIKFYWLFQLIVRAVFAIGAVPAVSALFAAVWAVALGCWARAAGAGRAGGWGAPFALAAVLLCQTRFEERPEVFSFAFLALQIGWLAARRFEDAPTAGFMLGFAAVQAAWSNCHGYFVLGPALVALRLLSFLGRPRPAPSGKGWAAWWMLLGATLLATILSPFGLGNWREVAVQAGFLRHMHYAIQELLPPTRVPGHLWTIALFEVCWIGLLAATVHAAITKGREQAFALLLAAAGRCLSMGSYRNIPLMVFFSGPLVGAILIRRTAPDRMAGGSWAAASAGVAAAVLAGWVVSGGFYRSLGGLPGFGVRESRYGCPVGFADYLRPAGFSGAIFNDPGDGGYLEFHFPRLRLYADTRFVDVRPVTSYFEALRDPSKLRARRSRQPFDAVLLRVAESPTVVATLLRDPGWRLAYSDLHRAFFVDAARPGAVVRAPALYQGEDLTQPAIGASATAWVAILAAAGDGPGILRALGQFSRAPRVPAGILKFALQFGRTAPDPRVTAAAAALRPAMICDPAGEAEAVDRLLRGAQGPL